MLGGINALDPSQGFQGQMPEQEQNQMQNIAAMQQAFWQTIAKQAETVSPTDKKEDHK